MNIKKTANLLLHFASKRLAEIFGIVIFSLGIMLLISLTTYSPEDPNFIFPDNIGIKNLLGFQGSFISDLFFQSIGLIAYLISFTFILSGINIFRFKEFFLIIENIFFVILYCVFGSLFLSYFHSTDFTLHINGSGGFVGNYLNQTFLNSLIKINEKLFYYFLIVFNLFLFLISINFSLKNFNSSTKKFINLFTENNNKNYTNKNEVINEYIPQDEIKNLIQEDLPFIKSEGRIENKIRFKLPSLDYLKIPAKWKY
jgi:DNA segregation ATPase FtsK/SpoIIIE, S-DNA-T family